MICSELRNYVEISASLYAPAKLPQSKKASVYIRRPIPVAARSKAWAFGRAVAGIVGSNSTGAWMFVSCECLCFQVEVSASGGSPVQRSHTEWGVSECDLATSKRRLPRPDFVCCATGQGGKK
jgi:hypothetical protein